MQISYFVKIEKHNYIIKSSTVTIAMDAYHKMIKEIDPEWEMFLASNGLLKMLKNVLKNILSDCDESSLTPDIDNIMTWAKFPMNNTKIIICSQDPYYSVDKEGNKVAHGLAFSTLDYRIPPSLRSIFQALKRSELIFDIPTTFNLSNWARQGVLLLNNALTTIVGTPKKHKLDWKPFTDCLFESISKHFAKSNTKLIYMLWGNDAKSKIKFIDDIHIIMTSAHPSPQAQRAIKDDRKKFTNCDHFKKANNILKSRNDSIIDWNPIISHVIYTDGSCRLNPKGTPITGSKANEKSVASWAYYVASGPFAKESSSGAVKIKECPMLIQANQDIDEKIKEITYTAYPTSIRAEGIAIIKALAHVCNNPVVYTGFITVKIDCKHWNDAFNKWKWFKDGYNHIEDKNLDIIKTLKLFIDVINKSIGELRIVYIPAAHNIDEPDDETSTEYYDYIYNTKVDTMAKDELKKC